MSPEKADEPRSPSPSHALRFYVSLDSSRAARSACELIELDGEHFQVF